METELNTRTSLCPFAFSRSNTMEHTRAAADRILRPLFVNTDIDYALDLSLFPGIDDPILRLQPQLLIHSPGTCACFQKYDPCHYSETSFTEDGQNHCYALPTNTMHSVISENITDYDLGSCMMCANCVKEFNASNTTANSNPADKILSHEDETGFLLSPHQLHFLIDDVTKDVDVIDQDLEMYLSSGKRKRINDNDTDVVSKRFRAEECSGLFRTDSDILSRRLRTDECSNSQFQGSARYLTSGLDMIRGV